MITRRSLFLGAAAVIVTPGLLMPVRKLIAPSNTLIEQIMTLGRVLDEQEVDADRWVIVHPDRLQEIKAFVDPGSIKGDCTVIAHGEIGVLEPQWRFIVSPRLV